MSVSVCREPISADEVPLGNTLACEVGECLNQLCIAENSKPAISLAKSYLVCRAWVFARLTFCRMSVTAHIFRGTDTPSARVYTGGLDSEDYDGMLAGVLDED
jgi:hypothetical protein